MLNPIKRVWVPPKKVDAPPAAESAAVPVGATEPAKPAKTRNVLFDDMPEPEVEERNSDSVWAEFDTVQPVHVKIK
jgi:hypothetical protein